MNIYNGSLSRLRLYRDITLDEPHSLLHADKTQPQFFLGLFKIESYSLVFDRKTN